MAITLKSKQQIAQLREAGRLVAQTYDVLREHIKPGISTADLDRIAEEFVRRRGAKPIYKGYGELRNRLGRVTRPAFPATLCISVNDVICHGIPSSKEKLREGDIVGIDMGVLLNGWVGDSCVTFAVGNVSDDAQRLLDVSKRCMELGIEQARAGNQLGDIGAAIQAYAESNGYSIVREWTGHGVGRSLHEEPTVLHYGKPHTGIKLKPGMVFTIEPMINAGDFETRVMADGWTVRTVDGSLSSQFEHTIAITDGEPEILTLP